MRALTAARAPCHPPSVPQGILLLFLKRNHRAFAIVIVSLTCFFEITDVEACEYIVQFKEPYAGDMDKLVFSIDLSQKNKGYCLR